jgi:cAMP phosphodiesterase
MKKEIILCLVMCLPCFGAKAQYEFPFVESEFDEITLEETGANQGIFIRLCALHRYRLAWCKIDTIDVNAGVFVKNFVITFKDTSMFRAAFVSSDFYQNRNKIKSCYIELDHISGYVLKFDDEDQLRKKFPALAHRLDYLIRKMKIKKAVLANNEW